MDLGSFTKIIFSVFNIYNMNIIVSLYAALLFFLLTPSILLRLPPNGSKWTVAAVHGLVFAVVFHFTNRFVWQVSMSLGL